MICMKLFEIARILYILYILGVESLLLTLCDDIVVFRRHCFLYEYGKRMHDEMSHLRAYMAQNLTHIDTF